MALLDGRIENSTYDARRLRNPRTLEFLKKITVRDDPALTAMYPGTIANRVTITLSSGESISSQVDDPKGHPKNPMSDKEIEAKFSGLTGGYLSEGQRREVLGRLWRLEKERDLPSLAKAFAVKVKG